MPHYHQSRQSARCYSRPFAVAEVPARVTASVAVVEADVVVAAVEHSVAAVDGAGSDVVGRQDAAAAVVAVFEWPVAGVVAAEPLADGEAFAVGDAVVAAVAAPMLVQFSDADYWLYPERRKALHCLSQVG